MNFRLHMTLSNSTHAEKRVEIAQGTLFEAVDPFSQVQNLVAAAPSVYALGPGESRAIVIDAWCFNKAYSPPNNTAMRLTALGTTVRYGSQDDVWDDQSRRR